MERVPRAYHHSSLPAFYDRPDQKKIDRKPVTKLWEPATLKTLDESLVFPIVPILEVPSVARLRLFRERASWEPHAIPPTSASIKDHMMSFVTPGFSDRWLASRWADESAESTFGVSPGEAAQREAEQDRDTKERITKLAMESGLTGEEWATKQTSSTWSIRIHGKYKGEVRLLMGESCHPHPAPRHRLCYL